MNLIMKLQKMQVSILFNYSIGTYLFSYNLKGIVNALDSVLLFVSIIVGFMGASISVFATVSDSKFAIKLNNKPIKARDNIFDFSIKEGLIGGLTKTKDRYLGKAKMTLKGIEYFNENEASPVFYKN